ncbi:MAG: alpha/beta hydrolase [Tannerellaceae bacterium]
MKKNVSRCVFTAFVLMCSMPAFAVHASNTAAVYQEKGEKPSKVTYKMETDIPYVANETDAYRKERCKLDVYYPDGQTNVATVVYFHGGGLEAGSKTVPNALREKGIAVVAPNYRLSPKANHPDYILDAAEAVAWTLQHIKSFGGDPTRVFVAGHSAGGYLTLMLAMDTTYLAKHGIDADQVAGYVPLSGQTNTHYTIRKERGLKSEIPIIDTFAPIYHARKMGTPLILVTGDRDKELLARYTENLHMKNILEAVGNEQIPLFELQGFDHGTMETPGLLLLLELMRK